MNISKVTQEMLSTWPGDLGRQVIHDETWLAGEAMGTAKVGRGYELTRPWLVPTRTALVGEEHVLRGPFYTAVMAVGHEIDYMIKVLDAPDREGKGDTANDNFDVTVKRISLDCRRRADGILFKGSQKSYCASNYIHNPALRGILLDNGSRDIDFSNNNVEADFNPKVKKEDQSEASGIIAYGVKISRGDGNVFFGLKRGIELLKCDSVQSNCNSFENCEIPITLGNDVEDCEVRGCWILNARSGCVVDLTGGDWAGRSPCGEGNVISGKIRSTKDPHYLDRNGNKVALKQGRFEIRT